MIKEFKPIRLHFQACTNNSCYPCKSSTWSILRLGSGVMTVLAEKSTRLPIKLPRILPSLLWSKTRFSLFVWPIVSWLNYGKVKHAHVKIHGTKNKVEMKNEGRTLCVHFLAHKFPLLHKYTLVLPVSADYGNIYGKMFLLTIHV